jgi:ABC-type bacteriocin/lantibiotic exporter with double-glycine peptidase domain
MEYYKQANVLIIDEGTSTLDYKKELAVIASN